MEQVRGTNYWMYTFTNAQLLNVKSADKSNSDRIVAENFLAMVFYTTLKIRNQDFKLHVNPLTACSVLSQFSEFNVEFLFRFQTVSLPIVIISHVMQEHQARAFLLWDAAFSKPVKTTTVCCDVINSVNIKRDVVFRITSASCLSIRTELRGARWQVFLTLSSSKTLVVV